MANDTGINSLFVVDSEYQDMSPTLLEKANRIQEIWNEYTTISDEIVGSQGAISGSRAKAYSEFVALAKQYVGNNPSDVGTESEKDLRVYVDMIDEADSVLY